MTGNGVSEILVAAFFGPRSSGLWVFSWSDEAKTFKPIPCYHAEGDLTRDMLVSDLRQDDGSDLFLETSGKARVLGMIYPADLVGEPVPGHYDYQLKDGRFEHTGTTPVPGAQE
jgi:hypothetical protein